MSWQGWDRKIPNPRQEPTPEPAPPSFHKPAAKKPKKPWTIEVRFRKWKRGEGVGYLVRSEEMDEWSVLGRYATEEARDQALAKCVRVNHRPGHVEYRAGAAPTPNSVVPQSLLTQGES